MGTSLRPRSTWIGVAALALLTSATLHPAWAAMTPMTYDELADLVRSEVPPALILKLLSDAGHPEVSISEIAALRRLGATDAVLEALVIAAPQVKIPAPEDTGEGYRAYYEEQADGGRVFILTNLDEDGARLQGSASGKVPANVVTSRPWEPEPEETPAAAPPPEASGYGPSANVEINLPGGASHPPAAYAQPPAQTTFVQTSPFFGFFYQLPTSHLYPPGSYTHLKLYHQRGRPGFGHYTLPAGQVFYNPLFPTAGTHGVRSHR